MRLFLQTDPNLLYKTRMDGFIGSWGKYRIKRFIAKGGMAEVFEAEITGPGTFVKPVCLKRIRPEFMSDPHFLKMFEAEARIAAKLDHGNIVSVFDYDAYEGEPFLVMEYVEGCNLKRLLADLNQRRIRPPLGFAVLVMDSLLAALDHAHTRRSATGELQPIIHRDVSPHNVLISNEGIVKLADFGIAKSGGISGPTTIGVVKGKLAYLAPEQLKGEAASVSSDLYSAGLVMLEILKGARPVEVASDGVALKRALFEFSPIPGVPERLNHFLAALLEPSPNARFQSAAAAQQALKNVGIPPVAAQDAARLIPPGPVSASAPPPSQRVKGPAAETRIATRAVPPVAETLEMPSAPDIFADSKGALPTHRASKPGPTPHSFPRVSLPETPARRRSGRAVIFAAVAFAAAFAVGILVLAKAMQSPASPNREQPPNPPPAKIPEVSPLGPIPSRGAQFNAPPGAPPIVTPSPPSTVSDTEAFSVVVIGAEVKPPEKTAPPKTRRHVDMTPPKPDAAHSDKSGFLSVNVNPWAEVFVDGESQGTTPIQKLELAAGPHTVRLENTVLGFNQTNRVTIQQDKIFMLNRDAQRKLEVSSGE